VLIKAAAVEAARACGTVSTADGLAEAFNPCKNEAEKAFGDGSLYLEKHLDGPRHVSSGSGRSSERDSSCERECSINAHQRSSRNALPA